MKSIKSSTKKAVEHIVYEIMMFEGTSHKLLSNIQDSFEKNILIESFAIRSRNLFDFFYEKRKKKDDIVAEDFILKKKEFKSKRIKKRLLQNLTKKTNKQIVHLTYSRNNYNSSTKAWNVPKINSSMNTTIVAFLECLGHEQKIWFRELYKRYNVPNIT